jgi:hypothetical protein
VVKPSTRTPVMKLAISTTKAEVRIWWLVSYTLVFNKCTTIFSWIYF